MAKVTGKVVIDIERCKGCEVCVKACPDQILALSESINKVGYHFSQMVSADCTGCANCAVMCPDAVITVYRKINK